MENRKIINATPTKVGNIAFKSKLEASIYKALRAEGLNPKYEQHKFVIWEGFKPSIPFYERNKRTKSIVPNNKKVMDITYTPDFSFNWNGYTVFVEAKPEGFTNDVYPYKQKLFRKYMETNMPNIKPIFVKVGTIKGLKEFIDILKHTFNEKS